MKAIRFVFLLICAAGLCWSCDAMMGEEVARLRIGKVSRENNLMIADTTLQLQAGDGFAIWAEMDIAYQGHVDFEYRMQVLKDGEEYGGFQFDPTADANLTVGETKVEVQGKTNWSFRKKSSSFKVDEAGSYTFQALMVATENESLEVNKADLVLRK